MASIFSMNRVCFVVAIATLARHFPVHGQDVAEVLGEVAHETEQKRFEADAAGVALDDASSMMAKPEQPAPKPVMRSEKEKVHHHKKKHHKKHKDHKEEEKVAAQVNVPHKVNVTHKINVTNKVYWDGTIKTQTKKMVEPKTPKLEVTAKEKVDQKLFEAEDAKLRVEMEKNRLAASEKLATFAKAAAAARAAQTQAGSSAARCLDYPRGWTDSQNDYCFMYEYARLCTPNKGYGAYWALLKGGNFSTYAVHNGSWAVDANPSRNQMIDATFACCACGGGTRPFTTTTYTTTTETGTTATATTTNLKDPGFHSLVDDDIIFNLVETS